MNNEFYVGYLPIPAGVRNFIRRLLIALGCVAGVIAAALVFGQHPFVASRFDYGHYKDHRGVYIEWPYPAILIPGEPSPWLLAGPGKHGPGNLREWDGRAVELKGERIAYGPDRMLELLPGSIRSISGNGSAIPTADFGEVRFTGEIVDSKCYFGVMNPGRGKVHRDCAARCLSGGIPPAFLVRDANGTAATLLLANWHSDLLRHIAEPVSLRGRLFRANGRLVLGLE